MSRKLRDAGIHSVLSLFKQTSDLSYKTKADYQAEALLMIKQLHGSGVQLSNIRHLKPKHVTRLITQWQNQQLNAGTIKNRVSVLRYLANRIGKKSLLPKTNEELGLSKRTIVSSTNRAQHQLDVSKITDRHVQLSLRLQQAFGLRREESIKFIPSVADKGDYVQLMGPWTKGGIQRNIPITNPKQRALLDELKRTIPTGESLIPKERSYKQQLDRYVYQTRQAKMRNLHGLRHGYAQRRYHELTKNLSGGEGWQCPKMNGPVRAELTEGQRRVDERARYIVSNELGHSRVGVTRIYLG